jgi:hypothetical protein
LDGKSIGVPSVGGMKSAFGDAAFGAAGGLIYALSRSLFGSGLIGSLLSIVLAGSVLKGTRATALATVAGFMLVAGGIGTSSNTSNAQTSRAVV